MLLPLTTQSRPSAYEIPLPRLPYLDRQSVVNVQGLGSMPTIRLERRPGVIPKAAREAIKKALAFALELSGGDEAG